MSYELPCKSGSEVFDLEVFESTGVAICKSLLDFCGINPMSRLPNTPFKNIKVMFLLLLYE